MQYSEQIQHIGLLVRVYRGKTEIMMYMCILGLEDFKDGEIVGVST